jgi:peptide/nickel transport system ATP-binding protein
MSIADQPLLSIRAINKHFPLRKGVFSRRHVVLKAVDGVSFDILRGETLALVGESGCGKSTVGKTIIGLIPPTDGSIWLSGERIDTLNGEAFRRRRRQVQFIFQDPYASLNPRMRVRDIISEPILNFGLAETSRDIDMRIAELIELVRLPGDAADRFPHEFSGGQRQRIGIARALAPRPDLIICDEAVSALDVSVKAQIVNLLQELKVELGLSLLFISHDLAVVDHIADRVAVMYLGRIVEIASRDALFENPQHPYTQALLSAVPVPDVNVERKRIVLQGDLPSPANPPPGCSFSSRCPAVFGRCKLETPQLRQTDTGHLAACHLLESTPQ